MSSRVEGIPVYESCNKRNTKLRDKYIELEAEEKRILEEIKRHEERLDEIYDNYKIINREEVVNVLDYVRSYTRTNNLQQTDIDSLLCHCQNKLNGNINSVFLTFDNPAEDKE